MNLIVGVIQVLLTIYSRFHAYNIGHLSSRASDPLFAPCTPAAVMRLLKSTNTPISGANAVVLGRSDIVGSPVASLLRNADATVTQCHSRTKNIPEIVSLTNFPRYQNLKFCSNSSRTLTLSWRRLERLNLSKEPGSSLVR